MSTDAIVVEGLRKSFGDVHALRGIDLRVPTGSVLGVLGPNGAGKTTAVKVLTTLLAPDAGTVLVQGRDVTRDPSGVREVIGLAGQSAAITTELTGRENLEFIGRLYHLGSAAGRARSIELLENFGLTDAADRRVKTYSGGMARRLDLAASLMARPQVLFLDEPTTGLDPRARIQMWEVIRDLVAAGTTLLLTTQYLDEADELADNIVVVDHGLIIAEGSADALKDRIGGDVVEIEFDDPHARESGPAVLEGLGDGPPTVGDGGVVSLHAGSHGSAVLMEAVRRLDAAGLPAAGVSVRRPSLDDVFLSLTGRTTEAEDGRTETGESA